MEAPKAKPNPAPKPTTEPKPEAPKQQVPSYVARMQELIRTGTVRDVLQYVNSDAYIRPSHSYYMTMLMPTDSIAIYGQADEVTNWYKRNLRIFTNINRITDFPNDRILLIIGGGHLKILKDFADYSPQFCQEEAGSYLK
jgi:hypothetical protein